MNLVTSYFKVKPLKGAVSLGKALQSPTDPAASLRQSEYLECLVRNCRHPAVTRLYLLVEGRAAYDHLVENVLDPASSNSRLSRGERQKIIPLLRLHPFMPCYADLFAHANRFSQGCPTMICNADVHLAPDHFSVDELVSLFNAHDAHRSEEVGEPHLKRLALALTRYESEDFREAPLIDDYRGSHDAFVLVPPVPDNFLTHVTHPQNCYQAENVVIYELQQNGYTVVNPCRDFRLVHRHAADVRQWFPSVDSTRYGRCAPVTLQEARAHTCWRPKTPPPE